jgi:hypothetical protein
MTLSTFFQGTKNTTLTTKDQRGDLADTTNQKDS